MNNISFLNLEKCLPAGKGWEGWKTGRKYRL